MGHLSLFRARGTGAEVLDQGILDKIADGATLLCGLALNQLHNLFFYLRADF